MQWGSPDSLGSQEKMEPLERREKLGFQEQEAQRESLEKDSQVPRAMKERKGAKEIKDRGGFQDPRGQRESRALWARLECLEYQFLDQLGLREIEEDLGCLVLKENLDFLLEDQRVPRVLEDQWVLQDSKAMAILAWLDLEECQDPLDQWACVVWETLEQRENKGSEALQVLLGLGALEPKDRRVTLGRKACLALLVPLAMDHKELKGSKDLKVFQGQRVQWAMAFLARREIMENGVMWERKAKKEKLENRDLQENRVYKDQKETWDLRKKKLSNLLLKYVVVGPNAKRLHWSWCL